MTRGSIGARGIRYLVDKYLDELGLKAEGISCHALRHSAATWSRAGGVRLDAIAGMLGHASVPTTGIYARIVDKIAENPAQYLEELMGLSQTKRVLPPIAHYHRPDLPSLPTTATYGIDHVLSARGGARQCMPPLDPGSLWHQCG
jgi:hypothetical protein